MARVRTPVAVAEMSGAAVKNPGRHASRKAPKGAELGGPSMWLSLHGKRAFAAFKRELPWLKESHRVLVEIASHLRGRIQDPEEVTGLQVFQELRRCLAQLGATPADESRVNTGDGEEADPDEDLIRPPPSSGTTAKPN